ncbi:hypothetical protein QQ045_001644 [Rhodiola kirilowii]
MVDKNLVLLSKWWWRLISGEGGLWRRMVLEKYAFRGMQDPREITVQSSKVSRSWKDIMKIVQGNSEVALALREGLKLNLGNGKVIKFWQDVWLGSQALKNQYPKLYSLALNSHASVREMGCWAGGCWQWHLTFRRRLYQWEEEAKKELEDGLSHIQLKEEKDDRMVWAYSPDGIFKTNTLMKAAIAIKAKKKKWEEIPFQLWSGIAPPKVEMLIWRVYLQSLPSKMMLQRRRVLRNQQDLLCVFCEAENESSDHLLIHCRWTWNLWCMCIKWWGVIWVFTQSAKCLLESWRIYDTSKTYKRLWKTLCYATVWSIWEERNLRCFQKKKRSLEEICELVKVRLAWWAKYRSSKCPYNISTISRCIEEVRDNY